MIILGLKSVGGDMLSKTYSKGQLVYVKYKHVCSKQIGVILKKVNYEGVKYIICCRLRIS